MKKVIKNKLYNTESAKEMGIASYSNPRDFNYWCETLYQKRTGEFFLHGDGNAASKYGVRVDSNTRTGGQKIIPLTYKQAQEWAEKYLDGDDYEKIFGEVTEGEDVSLTVWLSASADSKLRRIAAENGKTLAAQVAEMIEKY